ncbi:MAG: RimK-like protein [Thermoleophilia bacterium]
MTDNTGSPSVLILASRFDFTCDYIVSALMRRGVEYLRLNSEDLPECSVTLDPLEPRLAIRLENVRFLVTQDSLRSVLFRRPVFLRDYGDDNRTAQERFARIQWATLLQNLSVFDGARWYNNPSATYRAEHKAIQLREAFRLGMHVPPTFVTNEPLSASTRLPGDKYAVKGLDTVMVREGGDEIFGFTTFADASDMKDSAWALAPAIVQWAIPDKVDVRVTVIEQRTFAAEVLVDGAGVPDDWRLHKDRTHFVAHELPDEVSAKCVELVGALGLRFGAIDLAISGGVYFFLEINPTGEWAWLVDAAGLPMDEAIADELSR